MSRSTKPLAVPAIANAVHAIGKKIRRS